MLQHGKESRMKKALTDFGLAVLAALAVAAGLQIILTGELADAKTISVFRFRGIERLLGLIPIGLGLLIGLDLYAKWFGSGRR